MLKLGIVQPFREIFVGIFFSAISEDYQLIDWNVELLQGIELFFVVGIPDDDISLELIQLAEMIDLRNNLLERQVFSWGCLRSLFLSVLVLLLSLLWRRLLFFSLLVASFAFFILLHAPAGRFLLQIYSNLIQDNR